MVATMGQSPFASDAGTWIATWYNPAKPGANAAPYTVAGTLLIVTVTGVLVEYVLSPGVTTPGSVGGVVAPNPVPHRISTSPGFAGTVVSPAIVPFLTA